MSAATDGYARTLELLWAQRTDASARSLCDVRLAPDLFAHSFVLASASPVLAKALASRAPSPHLSKASSAVQHAALALAYDISGPARTLHAADLLELAALCAALAMPRAFAVVDDLLAASLSPAVTLAALRAAQPLQLPRATAAGRAILKRRLREVADGPEWPALALDRVAGVLRVQDLMPRDEEAVFRALETWVAADFDKRRAQAGALLRLVRFPTMSDKALIRVSRSPYFAGHDEFYQLLLEAFIRRAEVRLVHAPRIAECADATHSALVPSWRRAAVSDTSLGELAEGEAMNARQQRAVLFQGLFPLRWYKNLRFRTRSASSMLFTVVVPNWSSCRKRVRSESRSFADHRWSLWVDPYAAAAAAAAGETGAEITPQRLPREASAGSTSVQSEASTDYISLFLCCESELGDGAPVEMRVDYALFIASAGEQFGMERKVCTGRTFSADGQAMGFRRHTRRSRIAECGFYNSDRDEIVVGAHLVIPGAPDAGVERPDVEAMALSKIASEASKRSSQSTERSSLSWPRPGSVDLPENDPMRDLPEAAILNPVLATPAGRAFLAAEAEMLRQAEEQPRRAPRRPVDEIFLRGASAVSVRDADESGLATGAVRQ